MVDFYHFKIFKEWRISDTLYSEIDIDGKYSSCRQGINLSYTFISLLRMTILIFLIAASN